MFSAGELLGMRAAAEAAMMDRCTRLVWAAGTVDPYGMAAPGWSDGESLACGFRPTSRAEVMDGAEVVTAEAEVRLPVGTVLDHRDRERTFELLAGMDG